MAEFEKCKEELLDSLNPTENTAEKTTDEQFEQITPISPFEAFLALLILLKSPSFPCYRGWS